MSERKRRSTAAAASSSSFARPSPSPRLNQTLFANRFAMRAFAPAPPFLVEFSVLGSEEIEQQAVVQLAVDVVALPLPADEAEAEGFYGPTRRGTVDRQGIDRSEVRASAGKGQALGER